MARRSDRDPTSLGDGIESVLRDLGAAPKNAIRGLFSDWTDLVGDTLAAHVKPVSLKDGTLTVDVDDPAWAAQLRFVEVEMIARLNDSLGPETVVSVRRRARPRRH